MVGTSISIFAVLPLRAIITVTLSSPVELIPPARANMSVRFELVSSSGYRPGRATWPSTETCRLRTRITFRLTWGFSTNFPSISCPAIRASAPAGVRPAIAISPIRGKVMVPRSEMRVSVVRSGFWNTVMRTESPSPRVSRDWPTAPPGSVIAARQSKAANGLADRVLCRWNVSGALVVLASLFTWPAVGFAQTVVGNGTAVQATVFGLLGGTTTTLDGTGALGGTTDALDVSQVTGDVPSLLTAEALAATTIGWPDQVISHASLANLGLNLGVTTISADSVLATATALLGATGSGNAFIGNLSINGLPVAVTGEPNQTISIPGGQLVINEQAVSPASTAVNALHATVSGVADVVIGSAVAGIQ